MVELRQTEEIPTSLIIDTLPTREVAIDPRDLVPVKRRVPIIADAPLVERHRQKGYEAGKRFYLVEDGEGIAQSLANRMASVGIKTHVVGDPQEVAPDADGVVFLSAIRDYDNIDGAMTLNRQAFETAKRVAAHFANDGGVFIIVQDTGGNFGFDEWCEPNKAPLGGLAGLAKTAAREWPKATVRSIDLDAGHRDVMGLATELFEELLYGHGLEIGLPEGRRTKIVLDAQPLTNDELNNNRIATGDVVLVSGGGRGVTAECVVELAKASRAKFALLGRTKLEPEASDIAGCVSDAEIKRVLLDRAKAKQIAVTPRDLARTASNVMKCREIRETIRRIEETGSHVEYYPVPVTDFEKLCDCVEQIRKSFGPITTIIHGAGVLADKKIADKTTDDFDLVFNTKVAGMYALIVATNPDPIRTIVLFSSVAARFGNVGQADYAMANEVLNKMAHIEARARVDCLVKSLGWGPWDGGMVTPGLRKQFEESGIQLVGLRAGARQCVREMLQSAEGAPVEVILGDGFNVGPRNETAFDTIDVSRKDFPYLVDHQIKGTPVLPMVVAIDWMRDVANRALGVDDSEIADLQVVKALRLERFFDDEVTRLTVLAQYDGEKCEVTLASGSNIFYRAFAIPSPPHENSDVARPKRDPWEGEVYDGLVLFHGPEFHFLRQVDEPTRSDWWADLLGRDERAWADQFTCDVPALDGALQLAVLWSSAQTNGLCAPMRCEHFRVRSEKNPKHAHLRARKISDGAATADIRLYDETGSEVAELLGVTCVRYGAL